MCGNANFVVKKKKKKKGSIYQIQPKIRTSGTKMAWKDTRTIWKSDKWRQSSKKGMSYEKSNHI